MLDKDQLNIYNYFEADADPLYQKLSSLQVDDEVQIGKYKVLLNRFGMYEVSNDEIQDGFPSIDQCYKFIQELEDMDMEIKININIKKGR